jgi:hypothetical protein
MPPKLDTLRHCELCGKEFLTSRLYIKRGDGRFCSRSCSSASRPVRCAGVHGVASPHWRGGVIWTTPGYCYLKFPGHPRADRGGYVKRADLVMEVQLGRVLRPDEIVHHKNGVKGDDSPENLEVMTKSTHDLLHGSHRKRVPRVPKPDSPSNNRYVWPSDAEMLALHRDKSLREIAAIIGCSHKAVDRHLKYLYRRLGE